MAEATKKSGFLQEDNGTLSSTRLVFVLWGFGVFFVWAAASLKSWTLQSVPYEVVGLVTTMGAVKAAQKFGEKPQTG